MITAESPRPVRIAKIAGRYLIFDSEAASSLRRHANTNGVLVGTAPQQPTQNIFLGLPVELRPEEVNALVQSNAAYVVDDVAAHRATLRTYHDTTTRQIYVNSLQRRKHAALLVLAEKNAQKVEMTEKIRTEKQKAANEENELAETGNGGFPAPEPVSKGISSELVVKSIGITPTSSSSLVPENIDTRNRDDDSPHGPLCKHLQRSGYFMTPGLRFGAKYSVYPGDPLRFHAHFMANQYDWDEKIPILDIVGGGRLATAVKKAFLIGGEQPASESNPKPTVRTFSIEWAAM